MNMDIQGVNLHLTDAIVEHTRRRVGAALDQHAEDVQRVDVRLRDLNGPKGGVDMQCEIIVKLATGDEVLIKKAEVDLYSVISHAADSLKVSVNRRLDRVKQHHTH